MARTPTSHRNRGSQFSFEKLERIAQRCALVALIAIPLGLLTVAGVGCSQQTPQVTEQPNRQSQKSDTEQAAQGVSIIVNADPVNYGDGIDRQPGANDPTEADSEGAGTSPQLASAAKTRGSRVNVINVYNNVGTAATGAQAGGGQSGQSANATATPSNSATQKPEAAISGTAAVALPGGAANANGVAGTGKSAPTLTSDQKADGHAVLLNALASGAITPELFNAIAPLLGIQPVPTGAPTTQPTP